MSNGGLISGAFAEQSAHTGTALTTAGDLHGYGTSNTRIPIGTNNFSLLADSAQTLGLKWAASPTSILDATGKMLYSSSANTLAAISPGAEDTVLTMGGSSVPGWAAAAGGGNTFARVVKKADETVTSSTTLQDDDELLVALSANKTYGWQLWVYITSHATPGLKTGWTLPTGATGEKSNASFSSVTIDDMIDMTTARTHATDNTVQFIPYVGRVIMNSTAGNMQFQFSQDSSSGNATTVLEGSVLVVWEET